MDTFLVILGVWVLSFALCVYSIFFSDSSKGTLAVSKRMEGWRKISILFAASPILVIAAVAWAGFEMLFD
jgi:heme/copper-type cytochrome/quinol oxidase subunit 2